MCHSIWLLSRKYGTVWYHPASSKLWYLTLLSFVNFQEKLTSTSRDSLRVWSQLVRLAVCLARGALFASTSCTAQTLSSTPFLALLVLPLDASCFESCPCSLALLASHVTMNFLQRYACCPPMLVLCMWSWWKLLKGHPMVHAWLTLTRLPPFKYV
jgi:hypothetical protein